MTKQENIEKIAVCMSNHIGCCQDCKKCWKDTDDDSCEWIIYARRLYNQGLRFEKETVEEVIKKEIKHNTGDGQYFYYPYIQENLAKEYGIEFSQIIENLGYDPRDL